MTKLFFDANVVIDLLIERDPWIAHVRPVVAAVLDGRVDGCVSAASFPLLYYIIRRQAGDAAARVCVARCAATFDVAAVDGDVIRHSLMLDGADYEDKVQLASAIAAGCDLIVTRDAAGFRHSPIEAVDSAGATRRIAAVKS